MYRFDIFTVHTNADVHSEMPYMDSKTCLTSLHDLKCRKHNIAMSRRFFKKLKQVAERFLLPPGTA